MYHTHARSSLVSCRSPGVLAIVACGQGVLATALSNFRSLYPETRVFLTSRLGELTHVDRVRRNHALEHAAISIVTERHPTVFLSGRSNRKGFYVFGDIETDELESAVGEALRRLRSGEAELAIHPRCGTNLAVAGILSGLPASAPKCSATGRHFQTPPTCP